MSRQSFSILSFVCWLAAAAAGYYFWGDLLKFSGNLWEGPAIMTAVFLLVVAAIALWWILGTLSEHLIRLPKDTRRSITPEQAQAQAERESARALKEGRRESAIQILERANLLTKALALAEELEEKPATARLLRRLRRYARARQIYIQLGEWEAAGNTSTLLEEIPVARELYRKAAETSAAQNALGAHEAGLWDRAGVRDIAARVYERCGELELAAECHHLLGDEMTAARISDQAKAVNALEARQRAVVDRRIEDRRVETEKITAGQRAAQLEEEGDLLGAGILYRKAEKWMEAGIAFEKFEEWERAAEAYDKAGLADRAEIARMRMPAKAKTGEGEGEDGEGDLSVPSPAEAPPPVFRPLTSPAAVPVHLARAGVSLIDPEIQMEVAKRVRRGNFREAAELAKDANDWLMAAAYYEHAGDFLTAADLYRQIGNPISAAWCLNKSGRTCDAARMLFAGGEYRRGVETLIEGIERGEEGFEAALTLGDLMARRGKPALAVGLLKRRIAPEGANVASADAFYRFGCELAEAGAWSEAREVFQELADGGADCERLKSRLEEAVAQAGSSKTMVGQAPEGDAAMWKDALAVAREFIEKPDGAEAPATRRETKSGAPQGRFVYVPPEERDKSAQETGTVLLEAQQVSLFGMQSVATTRDGVGGGAATLEQGAAGATEMLPEGDPFKARRQRFERTREIARGGMGVVYEAVDSALGRKVALKLLQPEMIGRIGLKQFLLEARAIAMLSHPNIVVIYDIGMMDFRHYIAMEYLPGGSLAGLIRETRGLELKEALRIFIDMCHGIQAAHESGIIHRDIKPENALLTEKHQVKLVDFGLAMSSTGEAEADSAAFRMSGTPGFMPPEQYRGDRLLPACDVFALGMTLQCMLVGEAPHQTAARLGFTDVRKMQEAPNKPTLRDLCPTAPPVVDQVHTYCTIADPEQRYQSVDAFLPTLEKFSVTL